MKDNPLGYEVFTGNTHDSKTVEKILEKIEKLYRKPDRIWIMDRGLISPHNLKLLRTEERRYIMGTPKSALKKFEADATVRRSAENQNTPIQTVLFTQNGRRSPKLLSSLQRSL